MALLAAGHIKKMQTQSGDTVQYHLPIGEELVDMNALIGQSLQLQYRGVINCSHCGRKTKKSFNQGYCYPCFQRLAQCDSCIVSPEKCHYFEGTCREPEWGEAFCMQDHYVYLANSSGIKVGITRGTQIPTRWMDQGAIQALPIYRVSNRLQSGLVETVFKQHVADKTNWRAMLKGQVEPMDLASRREQLIADCQQDVAQLQERFGLQAIAPLNDAELHSFTYPVLEYPTKVVSFNFDKQDEVSGTLMGIKGQYLILDTGVLNMRKFTAYDVQLSAS